MKAKLIFNLPEDQDEFNQANRANDVEMAISAFSQELRSMYKHQGIETIGTYEARELLFKILNNNGVDTDFL